MSNQGTKSFESKKIVRELFSLTYGALVSQLIKDFENDEDVNKQLEKMGYKIGVRLVEDFMAHCNTGKCQDLRDTAEVLSKVLLF